MPEPAQTQPVAAEGSASCRDCPAFNPAQLIALGETHSDALATLQGLVRNMVACAMTEVADVRLAWEGGRIDEATRAIHSLRGAYGTLGAEAFANVAIELEAAIDEGREERVDALFDASTQALLAAIELAKRWLAGT